MTQKKNRTIYLIKRAEMAVRAGLETALGDLAVTPGQYTILSLLASRPDQSSAGLARKAGVTPQSMSETVTQLERKGLISRAENPEHRRILHISLTDAGNDLLTQCEARVDALEARLLEGLGEERVNLLRDNLAAIAQKTETA